MSSTKPELGLESRLFHLVPKLAHFSRPKLETLLASFSNENTEKKIEIDDIKCHAKVKFPLRQRSKFLVKMVS